MAASYNNLLSSALRVVYAPRYKIRTYPTVHDRIKRSTEIASHERNQTCSPGCNPEPGRQTHLHSSVPLHLEISSFNFCLVLENSNHPGKSKSTWKVSLPFLRKPNRGITNHINKLFIQCFKITCVAQLTIERGKVICSNFGQFPKR